LKAEEVTTMPSLIVCPSGLAGEIRGLTGREGKLLADRSLARSGATVDRILQSCWLKTTDPGVYDLADGASLDWSRVLVGDRFYALVQIRRQSFGDEYAFSVQCASAACRQRFEWELNLADMPVRLLSDDAKAAFRAGNRFETRFPRGGRKVWFRLLMGADETRAATLRRQGRDNLLLEAVALRIVEIENVAERDRRKFLDDVELADLTALLDACEEADCGIETSIEVECPACQGVQDVDLPFERGFLFPRSRRARTTQ
jgi:hypothetical protein